MTLNSLASWVGLRGSRTIETEGGMTVTPSAKLGWTHDWEDIAGHSVADLGGQTFVIDAASPSRDGVSYGLGLVAQVAQSVNLFANYSGESRSGLSRQALRAGFRWSW